MPPFSAVSVLSHSLLCCLTFPRHPHCLSEQQPQLHCLASSLLSPFCSTQAAQQSCSTWHIPLPSLLEMKEFLSLPHLDPCTATPWAALTGLSVQLPPTLRCIFMPYLLLPSLKGKRELESWCQQDAKYILPYPGEGIETYHQQLGCCQTTLSAYFGEG